MNDNNIFENADKDYKSFPSFDEWALTPFDQNRWDINIDKTKRFTETDPDVLKRACEIVKRAAAVDTGAIENLYDSNRGFTLTIATEAAIWEAAIDEKGAKVKSLFESQLRVYDMVLDLATKASPITEAWIRAIHTELCKPQETYTVITTEGSQEQELPLGVYKQMPNHVLKQNKEIHSYAPVAITPDEMHKFCEEVNSDKFTDAHPVLQASYTHYVLTVIHPFADGNGRVARALASVFSYRAASIPLLILIDHRDTYYHALEQADKGDFKLFVEFTSERAIDAIRLVEESIKSALLPNIKSLIEGLNNLYITDAGYTHDIVDGAGYQFIELLNNEIKGQMSKNFANSKNIVYDVKFQKASYSASSNKMRSPMGGKPSLIHISLHSSPPAEASVDHQFVIEVPKNCGKNDELIIRNIQNNEVISANINELLPKVVPSIKMRLSIAAERMISTLVIDLEKIAAKKINPV